jgi:small subunit ribosomal protein S21
MLIVTIKDGLTIDRALKILKNKVSKTKQNKELRDRQEFVKPSVKRRLEIQKAIYIQKLRDKEEKNN